MIHTHVHIIYLLEYEIILHASPHIPALQKPLQRQGEGKWQLLEFGRDWHVWWCFGNFFCSEKNFSKPESVERNSSSLGAINQCLPAVPLGTWWGGVCTSWGPPSTLSRSSQGFCRIEVWVNSEIHCYLTKPPWWGGDTGTLCPTLWWLQKALGP